MDRRALLKGLTGMALFGTSRIVPAQTWPSRPIRFIEAYAPGSTSDTVLRLIAPHIQAALGQPVIVDNRPGASGNIAAQICAAAEPDGHTFLMATNTMMTANPHLFTSGRVDPFKDFAFVLPVVNMGMVFVVKPDSPWKSIGDLITDARRKPGEISYGTPGVGSPMHLIGELLKERAGANMTHVPYKGGMPAVSDVMGGQIQVALIAYPVVTGLAQQGRVRIIAAAGSKRLAVLPDIPTVAELVPEADLGAWAAIVAPRATPAKVRSAMALEIDKALKRADVVEKLRPLGLDQIPGNDETVANLVRQEYDRIGSLIKRLDIRIS